MTEFGRQLKRNDGNCFLWGCATVTLVLVLGSIVAFLTVRYGIQQLREQYTDDAPVELPVVEINEEDLAALIARTDAFEQGLRDDEPLDPLTLTQDEINALFQNHADLEKFAGRVYVTIENDELTGQVSAPLDIFPGFDGRYFNGSATFDVGLENGRFSVFVKSATLKGEPVPESFIQGIRNENLAARIHEDPDSKELIDKLHSIVIAEGAVTITPAKLKEEPAVQDDP